MVPRMCAFDSWYRTLGIWFIFIILPILGVLLFLWLCYLAYFNPFYGYLLAFIFIICFGRAAYRKFVYS
jgi:hypothetical protein